MAATERPLSLPEWASADVLETVNGFEYPNKVEPSAGLKNSGLLYKQGLSRANFNYDKDLTNTWLAFFDANLTPIGSPIMVDPVLNPTYSSNIPTGWVAAGTQLIGDTTYDIYKRTT